MDTAEAGIVKARMDQVNLDEKALAQAAIPLDNGPQDLDPRPGFVTVTTPFQEKSCEFGGCEKSGLRSIAVEFDPASGAPIRMTRGVQTDVLYNRANQRQHVVAASNVEWNEDGTLRHVVETRRMGTSDSFSGEAIRAENSLRIETDCEGRILYSERYA